MDGVVPAGEGVLWPWGGGPSACLGLRRFVCGRQEMAQIKGTVPVDGQRRWIHLATQSMASPRW